MAVVEEGRAQGGRKTEGPPAWETQATLAAEEHPCDSRVRELSLVSAETGREPVGARVQLGDRDQGGAIRRSCSA